MTKVVGRKTGRHDFWFHFLNYVYSLNKAKYFLISPENINVNCVLLECHSARDFRAQSHTYMLEGVIWQMMNVQDVSWRPLLLFVRNGGISLIVESWLVILTAMLVLVKMTWQPVSFFDWKEGFLLIINRGLWYWPPICCQPKRLILPDDNLKAICSRF